MQFLFRLCFFFLYNNLCLVIILTKFRWGAPFFPFEYTVEVAEVVVATKVADVGNALVSIYEHACGVAQSYVDDVVAYGTSGM